MKLAFLFVLVPICAFGMDRVSALSMIESGGNDRLVGKVGEISRYQILKSEWRRVTRSTRYSDKATARFVMLQLMAGRIRAFENNFGRLPNDFEYYTLWNAPSQVMRGRISRRVAKRSQRFANLCGVEDHPVQTAAGFGRQTGFRASVTIDRPSVRGWGSGYDRGNDVSADGGHRVLMTRSRTEFALRQVIGDGFDERLIVGFATAQA